MQPALDSTILDRLISRGRERGYLTTEDLRTSLPVESMSAEEIALIVVQLEETGIAVELEESLLSLHANSAPLPRKSAEIIPFPGSRADRRSPMSKALQPAKPQAQEPSQSTGDSAPYAGWIVVAAGGLAFAVFSLIIYATAG
ncbi:MAG TPA: RNA polymerase sigma factor region1.1 domain-containing protein [Microvirga sp.]|nr:RNA polymerase sigma factor region1.1 domain-containing protein [Microvirga sp.]